MDVAFAPDERSTVYEQSLLIAMIGDIVAFLRDMARVRLQFDVVSGSCKDLAGYQFAGACFSAYHQSIDDGPWSHAQCIAR